MTHHRTVGAERDRRSAADNSARERKESDSKRNELDRRELDRRLDEALACTFPASDPFHLSPRNRPGDESD